jgi:CRP-like cAMP-binding protein
LIDTNIIAVPKEDFLNLISRNPIFEARLIENDIKGIHEVHQKYIDIITEDSKQNLAKTLYKLNFWFGNTLPFRHDEIAAMFGSTVETTTRILTPLRKANIITINRGKITINDFQKLRLYFENSRCS